MVVMVLERVTPGLRGELTRWLLEAKPGMFVGNVSGLVRDRLWERACKGIKEGGGILVHSADTEQGFAVRTCGAPRRRAVDFEGLILFKTPH